MKICFKCEKPLPLTEFYLHKGMKDGHLNKCKSCCKSYIKDYVKVKESTDLEWVLSERERHRKKSAKARAEGKIKKPDAFSRDMNYRKKYPLKYAARVLLGNAIRDKKITRGLCEVCGSEKTQAHHDDYHKPLDVRWLCIRHHNDHHIQERKNNLLLRMKNIPY